MFARRTDGALGKVDPWKIVQRWPPPRPGKSGEGSGQIGLRIEAKSAWRQLVEWAGGVNRELSLTSTLLGAEFGHGREMGDRAIESLKRNGLIEERPGRYKGQMTIHIRDPEEVWLRVRREIDAEQGEFEYPDEAPRQSWA